MLSDLRNAFRQLAKSPGFTAVAVISLALGIGAGTAVFSVVNAVLLRSLPVPNPHELRVLHWTGANVRIPSIESDYWEKAGERVIAESVSLPMFLELRAQTAERADVFGFCPLEDVVVRVQSEAFSTEGLMVSDNFFSSLGVRAFMGRLFSSGDDAAAEPNIVITHGWWKNHFSSDAEVLGRTVTIQSRNYTVIGVLPSDFPGIRPGDPREFYVSMSTGSPFLISDQSTARFWWVRLMARLKPGTNDAQLTSSLSAILAHGAGDAVKDATFLVKPGRSGLTFDRDAYSKPLTLILGVVGLVMLVACANLAGLLLARGSARRHELAVRAALGAGRWRLARQTLTESLVLASFGGGLGVLLAMWGRTAISRLLAGSADGLHYDLSLDLPVLAFSLATILATALLLGLLPALSAGRADPLDGLKNRLALDAPQLRTGRALVVTQICISLTVLATAGLFLRSMVKLRQIDPGFDTGNLLVFQLSPGSTGHKSGQLIAFYDDVQRKLASIPGVKGVTLMDRPLLADLEEGGGVVLDHQARLAAQTFTKRFTQRLAISETFFSTMGVPVVSGRGFSLADGPDALKVVVVNEAFVRNYLPGLDPIGHTMSMWGADWRIVGVCRDVRIQNIKVPALPTTYFPFRQRLYGKYQNYAIASACIAVRSSLPPFALADAARKAVASIDSGVPVANLTTQDQLLNHNIRQGNLLTLLTGALAALVLLLSCIGLYGLIAYNVVRRTSEFGIRMALGATSRHIAGPIMREALLLAGTGAALGTLVVLALTGFIKSQLYGVNPVDPLSLTTGALLLVAVAVFAAWIPARRATKVNPIEALRSE